MGKPVKIFLVTIFCIAFCYGLYVNLTQASEDIYVLDEITITGTRNERDTFSTPSAMSVVTSEELERQSFGTAADALNETAGVQIQKTTQGQGSPIIRGLTGYQTLILIDGVRLNSSTFRSGPNQYMATIDPGQIYRIEVMRGHGSSLYGTSAMGGVINVLTKSPVIMPKGFSIIPHVSTKFSSADSAKNVRLEFVGGYKNLGFVFGGSYKDVGNIKPGKGYDIQLPNKKFYITSQSNPKNLPEGAWLVDTESPTSWKEKDGDVKLNYLIADGQDIKLAYQAVRQKDIPRYDKLGDKEYDIFLFTPQNRDLIYANYTAREAIPFLDLLQLSVSYHKQEEGQEQQKVKSTSLKKVSDITDTLGLSLQMTSPISTRQKITYGGEFYHDKVNSKATTIDLKTNQKKVKAWGTFPDGSTYWDANAYLQDEVKILKNLEAILSGRYTRYGTQSNLSIGDPKFGVFKDSGDALTGSLGLVYGIMDGLNFTLTTAQSFRAPNLNDTTAVAVTNEGIDAPSPDLKPERSVGVDFGIKTRSKYFSASINYYFNKVKGLVTRIPVEEAYAGKELPQLYVDLQNSYKTQIFVKDNLDKADIQGVEIAVNRLAIPTIPNFSAFGNLTFTKGISYTRTGSQIIKEPIRREQPINGIFGIHWDKIKEIFWVEAFTRFATKQDRLSSGDIRDPRIPGTTMELKTYDPLAYSPGWFTLNTKAGMDIGGARITLGVENILNRRYREHGSGVDAPGVNFLANVDYRF